MNRKQFLGNFIGLIGVAANLKSISQIGSGNLSLVRLPKSTRIGDLVIKKDCSIWYFTGNKLKHIQGHLEPMDAVISNNPSEGFNVFCDAIGEFSSQNKTVQ